MSPQNQRRAYIAAGVVVLVLVLGQIIAPMVAGRVVRGMLDDRGHVDSAKVSAFPWVKLIFHKADTVTVHMSTLQLGTGQDIGEQVDKTRDAGKVNVTVDDANLGPLHLRDIEFHKSGNALSGQASVTQDDLSSALPFGDVTPVASGDGTLTVRGSFLGVSADAQLSASDGKLIVGGTGLASFGPSLTVFEDPRVEVTGVGARATQTGFTLTANGTLP